MKIYLPKSLLVLILSFSAFPLISYGIFQKIYPSDPNEIYVTKKYEETTKWIKVSESDNYSEYVSSEKTANNGDETITFFTLRNYYLQQRHKGIEYQSVIYIETVDCFSKTMEIETAFRWAKTFGKGELIESRKFGRSGYMTVEAGSTASDKLDKVCSMAGYDPESIGNI